MNIDHKTLTLALLAAFSTFLPATLQAQTIDESSYRLADAASLWSTTANAAGLTLDYLVDRGVAMMEGSHESRDFHRVQEGNQDNSLRFFTERYQHLGRYLYGYGKFDFDMGRTKNRRWSDVRRTYNSDPFISGSEVAGSYDRQDISLTAAVGTTAFGPWRFGLRLDYQLGDLSRLRDPRSRSEMLDYRLSPSFTYSIGRSTLGLEGHYRRYKEKIPDITTVQTDPNMKYYTMTGMENANGVVGGYNGYMREYVNHEFGFRLSYAWQSTSWSSLTEAGIDRSSEGIYGTYKYQPGHYHVYRYAITNKTTWRTPRWLHVVQARLQYEEGYADEYRQQLTITTDSTTGYNTYRYVNQMTYNKRYRVRLLDAALGYRLNSASEHGINGYIGVDGALRSVHNEYHLPASSFAYHYVDWGLAAGHGFFANRFWMDAAFRLRQVFDNRLSLADATTPYAQQVWTADYNDYYTVNSWRARLALTYQQPITVKGRTSMWFVRLDGGYLHAANSQHNSRASLAIGLRF